jgi:hypothetical protein
MPMLPGLQPMTLEAIEGLVENARQYTGAEREKILGHIREQHNVYERHAAEYQRAKQQIATWIAELTK